MVKLPNNSILTAAAAVTAAAGGVCLGSLLIDNHRFVVRQYTVPSEKITKPVRIVYITDLHEKDYGDDNAALVKAVSDAQPDLILSGGDQIVSGPALRSGETGDQWYRTGVSLMKKLAQIAPVMMAEGNHELRLRIPENNCSELYEKLRVSLKEAGVRWLSDESVRFGELTVCGLELPYRYYKRFGKARPDAGTISKRLGEAQTDTFVLLLAHNPAYFPAYAGWGADLTLSGHLHGGLMRLPAIGGVVSPAPALFPRYSDGLYHLEDRKMIVSCGLGTHTLPIRIFNPGELSVITLIPKGSRNGHTC